MTPHPNAFQDFFDRSSFVDVQDAYIGEGLVDSDEVNDALDDLEIAHNSHRIVLDYLATNVGEKYLDEVYKEDDSDDEDRRSCHDEFQPTKSSQSTRCHSGRSTGVKILRSGSTQTEQLSEEEVTRQRVEKAMAWQKVRRLLVEEEEKAAPTSHGNVGVSYFDTVKLLDVLARSGNGEYSKGSTSPDISKEEAHETASRLAIQRHTDWLGVTLNKRATNSSAHGSSSAHLALLTMLEKIDRSCRTTELSDISIARIASHLTMIDQLIREDTGYRQKRVFHQILSTRWSGESNRAESKLRNPAHSVENPRAMIAPSVRDSFKAFVSAQDLSDTQAAFDNLLADSGLGGTRLQEPWHVYLHIRHAVYHRLSFRRRQLFKLLDARFNMDVYKRCPAANKSVCVVGAGPVGLRAAVELALLGGHVSVLEKRTKFSRENRLHLWPWVVQDLAALGAKVLFKNFCKPRTYFHVSTRQLQVVLLKVALLVGVKVYPGTRFKAIVPPRSKENGGNPFYSIQTEPQIPVVKLTAVLGAMGVNDQLAEPAGINRFVFSQKESLGIVCYFPNMETDEEMKVKEFSWTAQLKHHMLDKMRNIGIDLENIVYFRGEMHYLVMTPKRHNLLRWGVVKSNERSPKDLIKDSNIDQSVLHAFVRRIVDFTGITRKADFTQITLFDFSSLTRADKAANIVTSHDKKLYIGLIGDSLLEPLWHEGVGTCRGFLSALDSVWMIAQIGKTTDEQILADRNVAYQVLQRLSGQHRAEMQKNVRKYTVDPRSRYLVDFPSVI